MLLFPPIKRQITGIYAMLESITLLKMRKTGLIFMMVLLLYKAPGIIGNINLSFGQKKKVINLTML